MILLRCTDLDSIRAPRPPLSNFSRTQQISATRSACGLKSKHKKLNWTHEILYTGNETTPLTTTSPKQTDQIFAGEPGALCPKLSGWVCVCLRSRNGPLALAFIPAHNSSARALETRTSGCRIYPAPSLSPSRILKACPSAVRCCTRTVYTPETTPSPPLKRHNTTRHQTHPHTHTHNNYNQFFFIKCIQPSPTLQARFDLYLN